MDETPPPGATAAQPPNRPLLGLVRPKDEAKVAGVCAAIGRVTGSDPLLWRVLFAVLVFFAGTGLIAYALVWLFTPAEDDTASPLEGLFGRGRSSTPFPLALVLAAGVAVAAFVVFWDSFPIAVILGGALIGAVVWLARTESRRRAARERYGREPYAEPVVPVPPEAPRTAPEPASGYRAPFAPYGPYAGYTTKSASHGNATAPAPERNEGGPRRPFLPPVAMPPRYGPPQTQGGSRPAGGTAPGAGPLHAPGTAPRPQGPAYPPPSAPKRVRPPKPRRPRSKLPWATLSVMAIAVGVLGVVDLAGASIVFGWYAATALAVCAGGLLIGTWIGRARSMIGVGMLLSVILLGYTAATWADEHWTSDVTWRPATVADIDREYHSRYGEGLLDLSRVDFDEGDDVSVDLTGEVGSLRVLLPPEVDATVHATVGFGSLDLFGELAEGAQSVSESDFGRDGPGGGSITITIELGTGEVEAIR